MIETPKLEGFVKGRGSVAEAFRQTRDELRRRLELLLGPK